VQFSGSFLIEYVSPLLHELTGTIFNPTTPLHLPYSHPRHTPIKTPHRLRLLEFDAKKRLPSVVIRYLHARSLNGFKDSWAMLFGCACGMEDVGIRRVGFYEGHLEGKESVVSVVLSNFQIKGFKDTFPVLTSSFTTSMTGSWYGPTG
jgi:hypothetical protein